MILNVPSQAQISAIESLLKNLITGTIASGQTSVTLENECFNESSIIDIYFEDKVLAPTNVSVESGSITIEIDAQETNTNIGVRCI